MVIAHRTKATITPRMIQPVVDIDFPPDTACECGRDPSPNAFSAAGRLGPGSSAAQVLGAKKKTPSRAWGSRLAIWGDGGGIAKSSRVQRRFPDFRSSSFQRFSKIFCRAAAVELYRN